MSQFLAFSKALFFPSYCYCCDEPINKNHYFCSLCQDQIEFLNTAGRCSICFCVEHVQQGVCLQCRKERFYDKRIYLFDSFSPVVHFANRKMSFSCLSSLFIMALFHFNLPIATHIEAESQMYKKVAKEMMRRLRELRGLARHKSVLIIAKESVSQGFIEKMAQKKIHSLNIALLSYF